MIILDGKATSQKIINDLSLEIRNLDLHPVLDIIIVGTDSASQKYVALKQQKAQSVAGKHQRNGNTAGTLHWPGADRREYLQLLFGHYGRRAWI